MSSCCCDLRIVNVGGGGAGGDNIFNADGDIPASTTRVTTLGAGSVLTFQGVFGTLLSVDGDTGKVTIPGLLDPIGLAITPQAANPGGPLAPSTLWINTADGHVYRDNVDLESGGGADSHLLNTNLVSSVVGTGAQTWTHDYQNTNATHTDIRTMRLEATREVYIGADNAVMRVRPVFGQAFLGSFTREAGFNYFSTSRGDAPFNGAVVDISEVQGDIFALLPTTDNDHSPQLRFYTQDGANWNSIEAAPSQSTQERYIWPPQDGSPGTALTTDGFGNLSWQAGGGGGGNGIYGGSGLLQTGNTIATIPALGTFQIHGGGLPRLIIDGDSGKVTIPGVIDPIGLAFTPHSFNPGGTLAASTLWVNSADGHVYRGSVDLEAGGGGGGGIYDGSGTLSGITVVTMGGQDLSFVGTDVSFAINDSINRLLAQAGTNSLLMSDAGGSLFTDNTPEGVTFNGSGLKVATFNGDINVTGVVDPTGVAFTPVAANPGGGLAASTLWINSSDGNRIYKGSINLEGTNTIYETDVTLGTLSTLRTHDVNGATILTNNVQQIRWNSVTGAATYMEMNNENCRLNGNDTVFIESPTLSINSLAGEYFLPTSPATTTSTSDNILVWNAGELQVRQASSLPDTNYAHANLIADAPRSHSFPSGTGLLETFFSEEEPGWQRVCNSGGAGTSTVAGDGAFASMKQVGAGITSEVLAGSGFARLSATAGLNFTRVQTNTNRIELQFGAAADLQLDGNAGTAGQVLTSNGAGTAPTWQAAGGGGLTANITEGTLNTAIDNRLVNFGGFNWQNTNVQNFIVSTAFQAEQFRVFGTGSTAVKGFFQLVDNQVATGTGEVVVRDSAGTLRTIPGGTPGQVLTAGTTPTTTPSWQTPAGGADTHYGANNLTATGLRNHNFSTHTIIENYTSGLHAIQFINGATQGSAQFRGDKMSFKASTDSAVNSGLLVAGSGSAYVGYLDEPDPIAWFVNTNGLNMQFGPLAHVADLRIENDPGTVGDQITSNGTGARPVWGPPASDIAVKNSVVDMLDYGLEAVMALVPKRFKYNGHDAARVGFVAQEVQEVMPEAVSMRSDGLLGLRKDDIVAALVNAVKELKAEIDSLRTS